MVNEVKPKTLTPYDLVAYEDQNSARGYEQFNNWSNWGNGPRNPAVLKENLEKAVS